VLSSGKGAWSLHSWMQVSGCAAESGGAACSGASSGSSLKNLFHGGGRAVSTDRYMASLVFRTRDNHRYIQLLNVNIFNQLFSLILPLKTIEHLLLLKILKRFN
jgi:hypothetical protein